ncbi:MAG: helix-turn-helix domain-containing protein [Clostridia bacterium]|nr:helix-turn-helix domain-containing protein [Clostridia bacterium]
MKTVTAERIRELRMQRRMTQQELGEKIGVKKAAINKYETGLVVNLKRSTIGLLAEALGVSPGYLMGWTDDVQGEVSPELMAMPSNVAPMEGMHMQRIPMLGKIAAGRPIMAVEDYTTWVAGPIRADFCLTIEGDSMRPNYLPGDVVYIRQQPDVLDGQVAAVIIDDEATLKHVYHRPDGLTLISDNPAYPPMIYTRENSDSLRILGLAIGFTRLTG